MNSSSENERAWYIIQTVPGCEAAAERNLQRRIESMNMQDYIFRTLIPEVTHIEKKKNGEEKIVSEKLHPGYVFVEMIVTDESWFVVRNTPMVIGILGSSGGGAKPVPLAPEEIIPILKEAGVKVYADIKFKVGDTVKVLTEPYKNKLLVVDAIDEEKLTVTVLVDMLGRQTPTELRIDEVEPLNE